MNRLLLLLLGMLAGSPLVLTGAVPPGKVPRPEPLRAVAVSDSQIRLSWQSHSNNAGDFRIERSTDAAHFVQIAQISALTNCYTDEGLISSTAYFYRTFSHTASGDSPYSYVAHAQTRGPKGHFSLTSWGLPIGDPPAKLDDLVAVAAGLHHQVALQKNGKVTAWGDANATNGQIKFPKGLNHIAAIAAGGFHSLALKSNGEVVAWGSNTNQQSVPPTPLKNVVGIAAGQNHSLALKADGTVVGWGDNSQGQCSPPTNLNHVVAIAAGGNHSLALKSNGTVVGWGEIIFRWQQPGWTNIVAIAAGVDHDLLLRRDGTVAVWISPWVWWNGFPPFELTNVMAIAAGETHNLALKADGTVVGWGYNRSGAASVPEGLSKVAFIAAGVNVSLALSVLPAPPLQFTARATTTNQVTLSWVDNCNDEDSYIIERALNVSYYLPGEWTRIATLRANTTHYSDSTVESGTIYWYRVRAHNRWGNSAATTASTQSLAMLLPPTPYYPYASIGISNCVNLQWNNYAWLDGIPDGFEVQRAPDIAGSPGLWIDVGAVHNLNATTVLFADTNAAPFQNYWYRIRAYNVFGVSDYTAAVNIALTPPPAPDILTVTPFADRLNLHWEVFFPFGSGMNAFNIERAPDIAGSPGTWSALTNLPIHEPYSYSYGYSDPGHEANTTWWYRVRTHNWIGYGPYSTATSATIVLPTAPGSLAGWLGGSHQVNLSWHQTPSDQNGFRIERAADAGGTPGSWSEIGVLRQTNSPDGLFTDKQVTALTTNWYRVRAFNQLGNSDYSTAISVAVMPPPQPTLSVSAVRDQFNLNYSLSGYRFATDNFDGYKIERASDVDGNPGTWTQIAQTFDESFTDSGHALNASSWYRVRASNWAGNGAYSPAVQATILPPGAPDTLVVRIGTTNRIELVWNDVHGDQDGFRLERAPDVIGLPGSWGEIASITTNNSVGYFTDTNAPTFATNWYRVRAFNLVGVSAYAEPVSVAVMPPPPPSFSYAQVNRDQVNYSWSSDYSTYGEVDGFIIERAPDAGGSPGVWEQIGQTASDQNQFSDSGRLMNTTWWYRARAYNWIGTGEPGPVASATMLPPATPNQMYGRIGASNQVDLNWSVPQADEDGFRLERAPDAGGIPGIWTEIAVIPATNIWWGYYSDTNLTALTTNWYRVRTFNLSGSSDFSPPTAIAFVPPPRPVSLSAAPDRDQVNLSWYVNFYDYGYVDGFKIERAPDLGGSPGDWSQIGTLTVTDTPAGFYSFTDSERAVNTTWWYRVHAFNWTGEGDYSPLARANIVPPSSPERFSGQVGSSNQVNLSWYQSKADADGFRLERASDDGGGPGVWTQIGLIPSTNTYFTAFTDTNVTAFTTNWYRVCSINLFGNSAYVDPIQVAVVPPSAPYYPHAEAHRDGINFSWYGVNYGPVDGYKIERAPDANGVPGTWSQVSQVDANSYSYSDTNLALNTTWWYRVRAYNWVGDGELSGETSATIVLPAAPEWLTGRIGSTNQVSLSWFDLAADADGFQIQRAPDVAGVPGTWTEIGVMLATDVYWSGFTDTNVTALSTNWYRVRAFNSLGGGDYIVSAAVPIVPPPVPTAYTGVYRDQVSLSWYFDYVDYYGRVDGFEIERAPDVAGAPGDWIQIGMVAVNNPTDSSFGFTDPARPVNTRFWYRLRAFNWVGEGEYTPAISATVLPPGSPGPYFYGFIGTTNQINLLWYDYYQDQDGFLVEHALDAGGAPGVWAVIAAIPATNSYFGNYTDTNVAAYTTNWYRVRAYSGLGLSGYSPTNCIKAIPPDAPGWLNANLNNTELVNLSWPPNYDTANGYELERATNTATGPGEWSALARFTNSSSRYYGDTDITSGGSYWYRVKAFNWIGDSPWSPLAVVQIASPSVAGGAVSAAVSISVPALRITSLALTNQDVRITWETAGDTTNVVQAAEDLAGGFSDISPPMVIWGSWDRHDQLSGFRRADQCQPQVLSD